MDSSKILEILCKKLEYIAKEENPELQYSKFYKTYLKEGHEGEENMTFEEFMEEDLPCESKVNNFYDGKQSGRVSTAKSILKLIKKLKLNERLS